MEIKYNVQAPPKKCFNGGAKSEEVKAIEDFLTSGNVKNMCFEYDTDKEAKTKLSTVLPTSANGMRKTPKCMTLTEWVTAFISFVYAVRI